MKRGAWLLLLLIGVVVAFFYFGGEAEGPEAPDIGNPDVNEATSGLREFFTNIANAVSGWNDGTWRIITVFVCAGICYWVFNKVPMIVWLVLAVIASIVAVQL